MKTCVLIQITTAAVVTVTGVLGSTGAAQGPAKPDAQMQMVLDQHAALGPKPLETLSPPEARKQPTPADAVMALLKKQGKPTAPEPVGKVENRSARAAAGDVPVRIYWPSGNGPFPVVFYVHGGGWVIANLDTYDTSARALTNAAQAIVVSTHYRQAPEHKFPAAHDDVYAVYRWTAENVKSLNGDPSRIAVAGESAGGNLAIHVAMRARDARQNMPLHQLLVYPIADHNFETPSYQQNANAKPLSRPAMQWFFKHYLRTEKDAADPRISVLNGDLKGLPSTTMITAGIDPLRSDGQALADRLTKAGVRVASRNYEGVTHEFFGMGAVLDKAKDAVQFAAMGLKESFIPNR